MGMMEIFRFLISADSRLFYNDHMLVEKQRRYHHSDTLSNAGTSLCHANHLLQTDRQDQSWICCGVDCSNTEAILDKKICKILLVLGGSNYSSILSNVML